MLVRNLFIAFIAGVALLFASPTAQSAITFLHWLNWPVFVWDDPAQESPYWSTKIGYLVWLLSKKGGALGYDGKFNSVPARSGESHVHDTHTNTADSYTGEEVAITASPVSFPGPDGLLRGWKIETNNPSNCSILYLHGNAGNIAVKHRVDLYQFFMGLPMSEKCTIYAIDYAGFGYSDRPSSGLFGYFPTEITAASDAEAVLHVLFEKEATKNVIVWAHSLGTAIIMKALEDLIDSAAENSEHWFQKAIDASWLRGVMLDAPFTSVTDIITGTLSKLTGFFVQPEYFENFVAKGVYSKFESKKRIAKVAEKIQRERIAILHGAQDAVCPHAHGESLSKEAGVQLHSFKNGGHDTLVYEPTLPNIVTAIFKKWLET